jgi:hypothetical protein
MMARLTVVKKVEEMVEMLAEMKVAMVTKLAELTVISWAGWSAVLMGYYLVLMTVSLKG